MTLYITLHTGETVEIPIINETDSERDPDKQPEKKIVPEPRLPLMHGSSQKCGAARAIRGRAGALQ